CLFCGSRGLSDAVLNAVMFLPLGLLLGVRRGVGAALLAGFVVSAGIETAQLFLVGRNAALGDVVWNTVGTGLGARLVGVLRGCLRTDSGRAAAGPAAVGLGALYLLAAGLLLAPRGTDARYFGQWTADLFYLDHYRGTLLDARLDGAPVPRGPYAPGPAAGGGSPRAALEGDFTLEAVVVKGPPPHGVAPVVSIYDGWQREILLLGAHREDLVFRERTRAQAVGLDFHDLRLRDALAPFAVGDTLTIGARRTDGVLCLRVDAGEVCGVGMTPGRTWGLLMNLEGAPPWFRTLLDALWMATLFVLVGVVGGGVRRTLLAGAAAVLAVLMVVAATPLVPGPWLDWAGLTLGVLAGAAARPLVRAFAGAAPGA
ncbi:MAG: VanZ family protein, partial [Longimicrobiales bacterium]|nr:VanZ family protein [Longimicrobiales bacterium]